MFESGSLQKAVEQLTLEDKDTLLEELRDGVLLSALPALQQLKGGAEKFRSFGHNYQTSTPF